MYKMLVLLPDSLAVRFRAAVSPKQRSKVITQLIEKEVNSREYSY